MDFSQNHSLSSYLITIDFEKAFEIHISVLGFSELWT